MVSYSSVQQGKQVTSLSQRALTIQLNEKPKIKGQAVLTFEIGLAQISCIQCICVVSIGV